MKDGAKRADEAVLLFALFVLTVVLVWATAMATFNEDEMYRQQIHGAPNSVLPTPPAQ